MFPTQNRFWTKTIDAIFILAGIIFLILALISTLNVALGWNADGNFYWLGLVYAALNSLVAYGLLTKQKWVLLAFGLNCLGTLIIFQFYPHPGARTLFNSMNLDSFMITLSTSIFLSAYGLRKHFSGNFLTIPFGIFAALWLISFSVNIF